MKVESRQYLIYEFIIYVHSGLPEGLGLMRLL